MCPPFRPATGLPNWAIALGILAVSGGTYYYVLQQVSAQDLNAQMEAEAARQDAAESRLCKAIPRGKVATYGAMAVALGSSARAVGQAMRRNPFAPEVPCHRVIASNLQLGGFNGSWGTGCANVQRKKALLQDEGVPFEGDKVASQGAVLTDEALEALLAAGAGADAAATGAAPARAPPTRQQRA